MKVRSSLDTAAISILIILVSLFGLVFFLGEQAGVRVKINLPEGGKVGPFQKIVLTFSEAVDPTLTASLFSIQPPINGLFEWLDEKTLQLVPVQPFELDTTYSLTLRQGDLTSTGKALKKEKSWEFYIREPLVVYIVSGEETSSLWAMDLNKTPAKQLVPENIGILSFDTSFDGEFIVFSSINEQTGIDLWRVSRAGNDAAILLDCGLDRCTTPIISPNDMYVAYSRELAGVGPDLPYGAPRIWLLDLQSGQNSPVYADQQIIGYGPSWSPDSTKLASFDGLADQIRLLDITNDKQYIFPSNTGGPITWSPDSTKLIYTDMEQTENGFRTHVKLADLSINKSTTLFGDRDDHDYSYYSLAWSPAKDAVVLGFQATQEKPGRVFWLFDPVVRDGIIIADEPDYTYNSPAWNPWGTALIFQQLKLGGTFKPEIGLWKAGFREPITLTQGSMPHWLP